MSFLSMFQKERRPQLLVIQDQDIKLDKEVDALLVKTRECMQELQKALLDNDVINKDAKMAEMENKLMLIKSKIDSLKGNLSQVMNIEIQNRDFIVINDDAYIQDKMNRLEQISQLLDELVEYFHEKPSSEDLKQSMGPVIMGRINMISASISGLISDDTSLQGIYQRVTAF